MMKLALVLLLTFPAVAKADSDVTWVLIRVLPVGATAVPCQTHQSFCTSGYVQTQTRGECEPLAEHYGRAVCVRSDTIYGYNY